MDSIKYIKKNKKHLNISAIADSVGMDKGNFHKSIFGDRTLPSDKLTNLDKLIKELKK